MIEFEDSIPCPLCKDIRNLTELVQNTDHELPCCGGHISIDGDLVTWKQPQQEEPKRFFGKLISLLNDKEKRRRVYLKFDPVLLFEDFLLNIRKEKLRKSADIMEEYYSYLLSKNELSDIWKARYLAEVECSKEAIALDFGCGRGRNISHLQNCGYSVWAQDIYRDTWWNKFSDVKFQVTPPQTTGLPWPDNSVDLVFSMGVLGFFKPEQVATLLQEFKRVLKPGGYVVLVESNRQSYAGRTFERYYGKSAYELSEVEQIADKYFKKKDTWYEAYYSRFMPRLTNQTYMSKFQAIGAWMLEDERENLIPTKRRGMWVLRLQNPCKEREEK